MHSLYVLLLGGGGGGEGGGPGPHGGPPGSYSPDVSLITVLLAIPLGVNKIRIENSIVLLEQ